MHLATTSAAPTTEPTMIAIIRLRCDNGVDACEEVDVAPLVTLEVELIVTEDEISKLSVTRRGASMWRQIWEEEEKPLLRQTMVWLIGLRMTSRCRRWFNTHESLGSWHA